MSEAPFITDKKRLNIEQYIDLCRNLSQQEEVVIIEENTGFNKFTRPFKISYDKQSLLLTVIALSAGLSRLGESRDLCWNIFGEQDVFLAPGVIEILEKSSADTIIGVMAKKFSGLTPVRIVLSCPSVCFIVKRKKSTDLCKVSIEYNQKIFNSEFLCGLLFRAEWTAIQLMASPKSSIQKMSLMREQEEESLKKAYVSKKLSQQNSGTDYSSL